MLDGLRVEIVVSTARRCSWRLLAGNGRIVAQSARDFADAPACAVHLRSLPGLPARDPEVRRGPDGWTWWVQDEQGDAVTSHRAYNRRSQALKSGRAFLRALRSEPAG